MSDERWRQLAENTAAMPNSRSGPSESLSDLRSFLSAFNGPTGLFPRGTQALVFHAQDYALLEQLGLGEAPALLGYQIRRSPLVEGVSAVPLDFVTCQGPGGRFLACVRFRNR